MKFTGDVGVQNLSDGVAAPLRLGRTGEVVVQKLHGSFYEQCVRGGLYGFGLANTVLAAANAIATGLTATAKPVIGLWNPMNSGVNLVVLKAQIIHTTLANTAVNTGGFSWCVAVNQANISTGSTPWSRKTLTQTGSQAKAFAISTALTGLIGSLTDTGMPVEVPNFTAAGAATAASLFTDGKGDFLDGSIIVPPGGVLAAMNLLSTTTVNVSAGAIWEEVPL